MEQLIPLIRFEIWFFLAILALLVGYQMLTGRINTAGLLQDKEHKDLSPVRVQLLLFTLIGAGSYLALAADMIETGAPSLPTVPAELLLLLGGSHAVYLGGKSYLRYFQRKPSPEG